MKTEMQNTSNNPSKFSRLLCRIGIHDYRVVNRTFGFGSGGNVETLEWVTHP